MSLGDFEQVILLALVRLEGEAHGVAIASEIERRTSRKVAPGALYTVLDRLEEKGLVKSWVGDSTPERGGRRRRVYRLQKAGARAVRDWYRDIQQLVSGTGPWLTKLLETDK
jgi:PadR family transcriptional regulator, regulatory protein PadR